MRTRNNMIAIKPPADATGTFRTVRCEKLRVWSMKRFGYFNKGIPLLMWLFILVNENRNSSPGSLVGVFPGFFGGDNVERNGGFAQHTLGYTAQQVAVNCPVPVGSHDDEIRF